MVICAQRRRRRRGVSDDFHLYMLDSAEMLATDLTLVHWTCEFHLLRSYDDADLLGICPDGKIGNTILVCVCVDFWTHHLCQLNRTSGSCIVAAVLGSYDLSK